jgi:acrylyl-CoA reductase (NADPH)
MAPRALRERAWDRLAKELAPSSLATVVSEVSLSGAVEAAHRLMQGEVRGRVVVRVAE